MKGYAEYASPIGPLYITEDGGAICAVSFSRPDCAAAVSPLLADAARQLGAYFDGRLREFSLPLAPSGTEFERAVWARLGLIPFGDTAAYGEIAAAVGRPKAARAVGAACRRNPIAVIVPCHRVVGAGGALTGYAGGLDKKAALLALERRQ